MLADGTVSRVLGWKNGEFAYDPTPAVFDSAEALQKAFVYNDFCASNLSKYLIKLSRAEGKTLIFVKPCDSYSLNQLLTEHRVKRESIYVIGVPCDGKVSENKIRENGVEGVTSITTEGETVTVHTLYGDTAFQKTDIMDDRCITCKSKKIVISDEILGENGDVDADSKRFDQVAQLDGMTPDAG